MVPWAVIPAAGQGTRLLPATAVVPKVLLPVGCRPMLDWTLREALDAGAARLIVVVSPGQPSVREYVEMALAAPQGPDHEELGARLREIDLRFVEQPSPAGIGDALIRCREVTGADPFAVLLPDNWFDAGEPPTAQVARCYEDTGLNAIGLVEVAPEQAKLLGNVGAVEIEAIEGDAYRIRRLADKRPGAFATHEPTLRGCARYVLDARFYQALEASGPPSEGEWDDVPAFQQLIATAGVAAQRIDGQLFDLGQPAGYMAANGYLAARGRG